METGSEPDGTDDRQEVQTTTRQWPGWSPQKYNESGHDMNFNLIEDQNEKNGK